MSEEKISEKPIPFSAPMVRAILDGRKSMTRRVIKPQPTTDGDLWCLGDKYFLSDEAMEDHLFHEVYGTKGTPYGSRYQDYGDRMWIKTGYTTRYDPERNQTHWKTEGGWITTHGQAISKTGKPKRDGGHPGMFMPKWLSQEFRLPLLEITDIRMERLQEISEADALAEGFTGYNCYRNPNFVNLVTDDGTLPEEEFRELWDQLNKDRGFGWDQNPWVWVISFKKLEV